MIYILIIILIFFTNQPYLAAQEVEKATSAPQPQRMTNVQPAKDAIGQSIVEKPRESTPQPHEPFAGPEVEKHESDTRYRKTCLIPAGHEGQPEKLVIGEDEEEEVAIIGSAVRPSTATDDPADAIEINFDNADLENVLKWVSDIFKINFLTDDAITPPPQNAKIVTGNKITFKTQKPLTKKQVWDLFLTFMDLFGMTVTKSSSTLYRVVNTDPKAARSAARSPLNAFINVHWTCLPNSDERIRYIYFIRNSTLATLQGIVDAFRSATSTLNALQDLNAFVLVDKSMNVRSVMQIIEELDAVSSPEALSVLKLQHADAEEVKAFYDNLTKTEDPRGLAARILGAKKTPSAIYFPDNTRVFAERRTNTLIILGTQEGIRKVEDFIINYVDTELKIPYSPLYVYELQYTKAEDMATILNAVVKFGADTPAGQSGGVRDGDKYLRPMTFQAEPSGNRLLISGEKEDYLKVVEIIKQLDVKQPQIAIEVLIVNVISTDNRELGVQIRNKNQQVFGNQINAQTSGFPVGGGFSSPIISPDGSLLGNLIQLAQGQTPGATLISVSNAVSSVWAMFKLLETQVHLNVVSNPFLVTVNNYQAQVSLGETRRVKTGEVQSQLKTDTEGDVTANLTVNITPLINNAGNINLQINISVDSFTDATDPSSATRDTKTIKTNANVGNGEVLAIGGLLKTNAVDTTSKVPLFGDIPFLGWLFKNKTKTKQKDNLLVFISPRIIEPKLKGGIGNYSKDKSEVAKETMRIMRQPGERRDIIHRWFFKDRPDENNDYIDNFIARENQAPWCDVSCSKLYVNNTTQVDNQPCIIPEDRIAPLAQSPATVPASQIGAPAQPIPVPAYSPPVNEVAKASPSNHASSMPAQVKMTAHQPKTRPKKTLFESLPSKGMEAAA